MMDKAIYPKHYQRAALPECQELIKGLLSDYSDILNEFELFCLGNVIKYIYRAPYKNKRRDLEKAKVYMDWLTENVE